MKKLLSIALAISMVLTMAGCLSSAYHVNAEFDYPYNATTDVWVNCLGVWGHETKSDIENAMDAYTKLVYPFWIVDFPLEVVIDTVAFPIDGTIYLCQDKPKK